MLVFDDGSGSNKFSPQKKLCQVDWTIQGHRQVPMEGTQTLRKNPCFFNGSR